MGQTPDSDKIAKNREKEGGIGEKRGKIENRGKIDKKEKSGRKGKNREGFFALPLTAKKLPKIGKNRGEIGKKGKKSERKGKNREGFFTIPLLTMLTDRAGYATESAWSIIAWTGVIRTKTPT